MIIEDKNIIFIHIPRTGGTSIENFFGVKMSNEEKHLTAREFKEQIPGYDRFYKFSFVRNPWERMLSYYLWRRSNKWGKEAHTRNFEEWLQYIRIHRNDSKTDHQKNFLKAIMQQYDFLHDGNGITLDFIGRMENFEKDFERIIEHTETKHKILPKALKQNRRHYSFYYNKPARQLVEKLYHKDIEEFGYSFEKPKLFFLKKIFSPTSGSIDNQFGKILGEEQDSFGTKNKDNLQNAAYSNPKAPRKTPKIHFSHDYTDVSKIKIPDSYSFIFVCQKGQLEIESLILAESLRRYAPKNSDLVAAIPKPFDIFGKPAEKTLDLLRDLGCRVEYFRNNIVSKIKKPNKRHFITNKNFSLTIPCNSEKKVFIDSDSFFYGHFRNSIEFGLPMTLIPEFYQGSECFQGKWKEYYEYFDLKLPNNRQIVTGNKGEFALRPPNFQTSFIAIGSNISGTFVRIWNKIWFEINNNNILSGNKYHIGQLAFSMAIERLSIPYIMIEDESFQLPRIHYIYPENLLSDEKWNRYFKRLLTENSEITKYIIELANKEIEPENKFGFLADMFRES